MGWGSGYRVRSQAFEGAHPPLKDCSPKIQRCAMSVLGAGFRDLAVHANPDLQKP